MSSPDRRSDADGAADVTAVRLSDQVLHWRAQVADHCPRVVFSDGHDPRVQAAARWLAANTRLRPLLLVGEDCAPGDGGDGGDADGVRRSRVGAVGRRGDVAAALRTRANGVERSEAEVAARSHDTVYVGAALVAAGGADACVAGATRPTGEVIRAALSVIGLGPQVSTVSSSFLFVLPDGRRLAYGDCAVLPLPDERELAQVAVATARTYKELIGEEPAVAMLSFSTMGSAQHPEVDTVRAATDIARRLQPDLCIDGELQFDAAMLESVGHVKAAGSPVAGHANVLIFPNLSAGNIGYKITERLAGATAVGPILQGLAAPMNDLSRGCSTSDVVAVALLSAVQAVSAAGRRPAADVDAALTRHPATPV